MNEPLHDIDKLFHDNIEGHSEYPPQKVWDKIEAGLDKDTAVVYKKKYKTLKRAAAILLILFLSVVIYELVNRKPVKQDVAGSEKKTEQSTNKIDQKENNISNPSNNDNNNSEVINQGQNKNTQLQDKQNDLIPVEKKGPGSDQSPVISTSDAGKINDNLPKKEIVNNDGRKDNQDNTLKGDNKNSKQKTNNPLVKSNNVDIDVITPGKTKTGKDNAGIISNLPARPTTNEDNENSKTDQVTRLPFFTLTPVGPWRKNIASDANSGVNISAGSPERFLEKLIRPANKKSNNPVFRNYGLSLSVYFIPTASWNSLEDDKPYNPPSGGGGGGGGRPVDHKEIKESEQNSSAYSGGIKLSYGFNKKISVQAGLNYTKNSTSIESKEIYADRDNNGNVRYRVDCSSGYTYVQPHSGSNPSPGDRITMTDNKNTLSYLGIPLTVEYRVSFGKFSVSPSAGGQVNILLKGKTTAVLGKGTSNETSVSSNTEGLKSKYFSALAGVTGELQLNKKLSLTIAPSGQFALSSINNGASVKTRPNYFGLGAGLKLKL